MRSEFTLPPRDVEFLTFAGRPWETIGPPGGGYLLVHEFPIPEGYNHRRATVAMRIEPGYDDTQIDMAYFFPALARLDGKPIGALKTVTIDEKQFQRWSRHRTGANPWRPGVDYVGTHLELVGQWLVREFSKH